MSWTHHLKVSLLLMTTLVVVILFTTRAAALEFYCEAPGDIRFMRVDIPGQDRLCEVAVSYQATGERRVMWYAENDSMFCSTKAYELRNKYEDQWNFDCQKWPDRDGIDNLPSSQRAILDQRLKRLIAQGQSDIPGFEVQRVRVQSSTPLDQQSGFLAIQFFLSTGNLTEVIALENNGWTLFAQYDDLANYIASEKTVSMAMIESINETAAIEVSTHLKDGQNIECFGQQTLLASFNNELSPQSPHRELCNLSAAQ